MALAYNRSLGFATVLLNAGRFRAAAGNRVTLKGYQGRNLANEGIGEFSPTTIERLQTLRRVWQKQAFG